MNEGLKEVGKGLIAFANIIFALVFFKYYFDRDNTMYLVIGVFIFIILYITGFKFISVGKNLEKEDEI